MLERLLVPLDSTQNAEHVIPYVTMLAKQLRQPIVLLSVVDDPGELNPVVSDFEAIIAAFAEQRYQHAQHYLEGVRDKLQQEGVSATTMVVAGKAAETIVATAEAQHAELIAMSTHGRVGPERWFMGSVADKVVRTATIPVLLMRPRAEAETSSASVRAVIVPLDGSPLAEAALPYATFIAQAFNAPVSLVRAVPMTWIMSSSDAYGVDAGSSAEVIQLIENEAEDYLRRTAEKLQAAGLTVNTHFARFVPPASEITDWAEATAGALVVMTTHGRSGLGRTLLGGIADHVIRSSAAPVLVIRPTEVGLA